MKKRNKRNRLLRRIFGSIGCLGLLALVAVGAYLGYQALQPLFVSQNPYGPYDMATQDVGVERGDVTDMLQAYGLVRTYKDASIGFDIARGRVVSVNVSPQQMVRAGQVLVELDREALERDMAKAKADLQEAETKLAEFSKPPSATERLKLQAELLRANETLDKAKRALADFDAGKGTPLAKRQEAVEELEAAKLARQLLRENKDRQEQIEYLQWIYNIAEVEHGPYVLIQNPSEKDLDIAHLLRIDMLNKRDDLASAKLQYQIDLREAERRAKLAERALAEIDRELEAGVQEVARLRLANAVQVAESEVKRIQAELDTLGEERPNVEKARAEANVLKRRWLVQDAESALADAQLVAPFDGIVEQVTVVPGSMVNSAMAIVTLIDPLDVYIEARVTEVDVSYLTPGQEIEVRFDAFYGQPPPAGRVGEIPLYGQYEGGITYFRVPVAFEPGEIRPMIGMSVNLAIPKASKQDVLVIPTMAAYRGPDGHFVYKVENENVVRQPVKLGISDGIHSEVLEGLAEGDTIRVPMYGPVGPYGPMWRG